MKYIPTQLLCWKEAREILLGSLLEQFPNRELPIELSWYEEKQKENWQKHYIVDDVKREKLKQEWISKYNQEESNNG